MRPVNLIPLEDRRGESAPSRTGALSYIIVGVLAVALIAVTGTVLTSKSVKDKKAEVAGLEQKASESEARAASLASFAEFQALKDARVQTITQLATSRFDWARVMRELSRVLPKHVWLVKLTGKSSPEVTIPEEANVSLRSTVPGYALELVGCARSQRAVAALITSMEDIDGVTRVTAGKSEKPKGDIAASAGDQVREDCRTRSYVTQFELVAALDNPSPPVGGDVAPAPAPGATPAQPAPTGSDGGVGEAQQANAQHADQVAAADSKAQEATNLVPGGGG